MISLNPKKAKKKMKKAALAEDSTCVDSRLPVNKFDAVTPMKKLKPAPEVDSASIFKLDGLNKKSWYDISMDDDDDFLGALSNY